MGDLQLQGSALQFPTYPVTWVMAGWLIYSEVTLLFVRNRRLNG